MPVKLKDSYTPDSIPVYEMKDGQIGVITEWGQSTNYIGYIVQRYGKELIRLGCGKDSGWGEFFVNNQLCGVMRVRLLKRGELIEIQDN